MPKSRAAITQDHPRACGEKIGAEVSISYNRGSPPRMRGKGNDGNGFLYYVRITPAHAGKRIMPLKAGQSQRDHPRACGEKYQ